MSGEQYASNVTDEQWLIVEPLLPNPSRIGRRRTDQSSLRLGCDFLSAAHRLPMAAAAQRFSRLEHGPLFSGMAANRCLDSSPA
jgi:transposase